MGPNEGLIDIDNSRSNNNTNNNINNNNNNQNNNNQNQVNPNNNNNYNPNVNYNNRNNNNNNYNKPTIPTKRNYQEMQKTDLYDYIVKLETKVKRQKNTINQHKNFKFNKNDLKFLVSFFSIFLLKIFFFKTFY